MNGGKVSEIESPGRIRLPVAQISAQIEDGDAVAGIGDEQLTEKQAGGAQDDW